VKVESDEYLVAALERAQTGAKFPSLVESVLAQSGDVSVSPEEAQAYVKELIENQVLVSSLSPLLTGKPALDDIISQVESLPSGGRIADTLRRAQDGMAALDQKGLGCAPSEYEEIAAGLESLPAKAEPERLYQVDMIKPVQDALLGKQVMAELIGGVEVLCRLSQTSELEELRSFREAFSERYERAKVPLLEALDEEAGVGFGRSAQGTDVAPLIRGLGLGVVGGGAKGGLPDSHSLLLRQLVERAQDGTKELLLNLSDLRSSENVARSLADAFSVEATLVASSAAAVQEGEFELLLKGGVGPSGARMLGRFCHADPELEPWVRNHLKQEEAHAPEAVYAEIVYLPEGRIGNVLCRPVLRDYEIPYLGRSGAPPDRQLPVTDLLVSVDGGSIVLYSQRLGRQVIPRLTNAHGFMNPQLASVYRFLSCLQHQHGTFVPGFSWGSLEALDFLPRVKVGRLVLAVARWRLSRKEIDAVAKQEKSHRFLAIQELRRRRGLPRWIVFQESDNTLTIDLDNALSVDAFVHVLKRASQAVLLEMYPTPDQLCVTSREGRFNHELIVPFVRRPRAAESERTPSSKSEQTAAVGTVAVIDRPTRTMPPGSEWLYVKLYGGGAALDDVLTTAVPSLVRTACASGIVSRWFFIRYTDPHQHLRIRFNGPPDGLRQQLTALVSDAFNPLVASGRLWKIQFDTYEREIERYGGVEGALAAEDIFSSDSGAVVEILQGLGGDEGVDNRWRIALLGVDRLLSDCEFDLAAKRAAVERLRDSSHREFRTGVSTKKQLGDKFRGERQKLEALLGYSSQRSAELELAGPIFENRSVRVGEVIRRLRSLVVSGRLTVDIAELAPSYVHMHVNRLIRSAQRAHELVLYDFLFRLYDGKLARDAKAPSRNAAPQTSEE
jgi:thiopeptide-type bacteriocin biosynthesis protein